MTLSGNGQLTMDNDAHNNICAVIAGLTQSCSEDCKDTIKASDIKQLFEAVNTEKVKEWKDENIGETLFSEKRKMITRIFS